MIDIKIPDLAGNRTQAAGMEGRDSTYHATATSDVPRLFEIRDAILYAIRRVQEDMYVRIFGVLGRVNISGHWRP